jgi:peptidoglycan/xylan/chitin deacetylase (PgdA/CDA1 family)
MRLLRLITICLAALPVLIQAVETAQTPSRQMALTFDDLPYAASARQPFLSNAQRATKQTLAVLNQHRAPAVAFVNEINLQGAESASRIALLQQWLDAGMTLGNHTYSHTDFNRMTVEQFEQEILKGEVITRRLMTAKKLELRYFRHPATHAGDTKEKKEAIEKFLAAHGYEVAPHTIENSDFVFTVPYSRALQQQDEAQLKRLRDAYLDYTLAATRFAEEIAPQIFGREVPQTLLLHANDINADCLDEMLKRFEARGYRFVTLDEAMADPAYQTKDTLVSDRGPTWLWRWMRSMEMNLSFKDDPEPPRWVVELFNQR